MRLVRYADEPELRAIRFEVLSQQTFPEYMQHNIPGSKYWSRLYEDFPDFQLALVDGDELVAEFHSVPTAWDGTDADLPSGWDVLRPPGRRHPGSGRQHGHAAQR